MKSTEPLADGKANKHDLNFDGRGVAGIAQRRLQAQVFCGSDFTQQQVHQMLTKHHAKALGLKFTKLDEQPKTSLNGGLLVSPTACELHVPTVLLQGMYSKRKIDIPLGGHVVNDPMTHRDLADSMTQLDFNDPTRPNEPVDPVDQSQV